LKCPGTEVTNLIFTNDSVAMVSWKNSVDVAAGKNINVKVVTYVTTQAQLKLYLSELGQSVLYCNTDLGIPFSDPKSKIGDYVGDLAGALE
jgi:flagellar basal body P-ring protein FlgI